MDDEIDDYDPKRGTALLVIAIIFVAFTFGFLILPKVFGPPDISVRVAVIDSGITPDERLSSYIIAEASFINETYGYATTDNSTTDSEPFGSLHGTNVAQIIIHESPNAGIINAKVVDSRDKATTQAIIAAIRWAVEEQDSDVINLSIGNSPRNNDGMKEVVRWAFQQGVVIVAAAGNNGKEGLAGSSVQSPAVYPEVIAVGAIDGDGKAYSYSGHGPSFDRSLKPDISATGYYDENSIMFVGTSASTPIVTSAVVELIRFCQDNGWRWTPGMIKAVLLSSARFLGSEPWAVGAGVVNVDLAKGFIKSADKIDGLPLIAWISPNQGIFEFERWFLNTTYTIRINVFSSTNASFVVRTTGTASPWIDAPTHIEVNQSGQFDAKIRVNSMIPWTSLRGRIFLISDRYRAIDTSIAFDATPYVKKVGFDFTHSSSWTDSVYGQFRSFYSKLAEIGFAVEELRDRSEITLNRFRQFDAIIVLNPSRWEFVEREGKLVQSGSIPYSQEEIEVYRTYWEKGGNLLITGGDNRSIDVSNANRLFSAFNFSLNFDRVPTSVVMHEGLPNAVQVVNVREHEITSGVQSFDYYGASLNVSGNATVLAYEVFSWIDKNGASHTALKPVLAASEGRSSARMIVTGTNSFLDNFGLNNYYGAEDDWLLVRRSIYWITGYF